MLATDRHALADRTTPGGTTMPRIERSSRHPALRRHAAGALAFLLLAGGVTACATNTLQGSWKDPQFTGAPLRNVMVLGVARDQSNRRIFEDNFVQALKARGTPATASYPLLPEDGVIPRDRIKQAMTQSGSDSILVTRVLRVQRNVLVTPGRAAPDYARDDFQGWYSQTYSTPPPAVEKYDILTLESTLWDLRKEHVVWKGTTETTVRKDVATITGELSSALIAKMKSDGVI
jgi:hypothetical protein